ncbi:MULTISPECIES: hypothetical protein [Streptomyces]|uniref:hypothetical protein n=1 Tax=Streptomyces TaxID=1883 RepID=UPI00345B55F3
MTPHRGVHQPWSFTCGTDGCVVRLAENPTNEIVAALLEDIGDWHHALTSLQRTNVPPGVLTALAQLHDAVCGWSELTNRRHNDA